MFLYFCNGFEILLLLSLLLGLQLVLQVFVFLLNLSNILQVLFPLSHLLRLQQTFSISATLLDLSDHLKVLLSLTLLLGFQLCFEFLALSLALGQSFLEFLPFSYKLSLKPILLLLEGFSDFLKFVIELFARDALEGVQTLNKFALVVEHDPLLIRSHSQLLS